jgi:hypothetical protein
VALRDSGDIVVTAIEVFYSKVFGAVNVIESSRMFTSGEGAFEDGG